MSLSTPFVPLRKRAWVKRVGILAVVLVPLAFAGLVVGALSGADTAADRIPAAIVNEDTLITTTNADGTETNVFAGRLLVTELTGGASGSSSDSSSTALSTEAGGFDWIITNAEDAEAALKAGEVYAVLTVPKNFSESILSLSSDTPVTADLSIRTDDAHSYLAGSVVQAVGSGLASTFGNQITSQYLAGLYESVGDIGTAFADAASGATELQGGASDLSTGLADLSAGAASAQTGAASLSTGVSKYTAGVSGLSTGLAQLNSGAAGLSQISSGVASYTGGVSQLSAGISAAAAALRTNPNDATALATLESLAGQLSGTAAGGSTLSGQTSGAISGIQTGISQSATGAAQLAAGSRQLNTGASSLATGLSSLTSGATDASTGAGSLAAGAGDLATGLQQGADQIPSSDTGDAAATAEVVADPVTLTVDRDNEVSKVTQVIATFFVPLGLWIGALAVFLVLAPLSSRAMASSARGSRIMASTLGRASIITALQAVALVALLHTGLGVSWALLPATLGFSVLMALAFTAFHYLLTVGLGRGGLVISLLLLAIQVTSTGGLYPVEALAGPFQFVSPLLPLTWGVQGMQSIVADAEAGRAVAASLVLLGFGLVSTLLATVAVRRTRRAVALGLLTATA